MNYRIFGVVLALCAIAIVYEGIGHQPSAATVLLPSLLSEQETARLFGGQLPPPCENKGCTRAITCVTANPPNGAACDSAITTTCSNNSATTCRMLQLVTGMGCGDRPGYRQCHETVNTTMCANILTGITEPLGDCVGKCVTTSSTCGALQVTCGDTICPGS